MKKNVWLFALLLASMAFGLDLVKDGKPCAEIIVEKGANSGVVLAAKDLQYHLERMSGAKLELLNEPSEKELNRVFVGESRFTRELGYTLPEFGNSGYDILVKGNYARISPWMSRRGGIIVSQCRVVLIQRICAGQSERHCSWMESMSVILRQTPT